MSIVLVSSCVVGVVGREQRGVDSATYLEQVRHDRTLSRETMVLQFDEEVVSTEDVLESGRSRNRRIDILHLPLVALLAHRVGSEKLGNHATETSRCCDQPLGMFLEEVEIHPWLVVVAVEESLRRELEQVLIADIRFSEKIHVVTLVGVANWPVESRALDEVRLYADDGLDAGSPSCPYEVDNAIENAVVGDGYRRLVVPHRCGDNVFDSGCAVEHRVLGMQMEMGEGHFVETYTSVVLGNLAPIDRVGDLAKTPAVVTDLDLRE